MNKTELTNAVAYALELPNGKSAEVVNTVFNLISETLTAGTEVNITGFGKFEVKQTKARVGHNPKTGDPVDIPAKTVVKFKPGKALKDKVNG